MFPKNKPIKNKEVFEKIDTRRCMLCGCGKQPIQRHHIVPRSHIRLDIEENLAPLCPPCHEKMKSPEARIFTKIVIQRKGKEAEMVLREKAPTWKFWTLLDMEMLENEKDKD